ncbi:hypothetical protein D3C72_1410830 [compost metagenome]
MVAFGRFGFDHHFTLQNVFFDSADFGVTHHAALEQQKTRRRADPRIDSHRRIVLTGPGHYPAHAFELSMHILHRFNRLLEQFAKRIRDHFRAGVLDKKGFARLGD